MKILHITPVYIPAYKYGGPVKSTHGLCSALSKKGHDVSVYTTNAGVSGDNMDLSKVVVRNVEGVEVTYYPAALIDKYYYCPAMSSSIKKNLKRFNIAHIHSVFLYPTYIGARWCQEMGMPYIMDPFGALDPDMINFKSPLLKNIYISLIEKNNLEKSSCVNLTSDYEKNKFMKLNINVPIAIVPRAVNLSEYVQNKLDNSILKMYPELKGKKIILFLGRIHLKKGLDLLINAFKKVVSFDKDAYLLIAGPQEDNCVFKIKNMIKKYSLSEHVVFTGMMLGDNKLDILHMSDLFVLSSYGENFGLAVLEAMACSLPVVITDRVGLCKEVEANNAGFVTSCNSEKIAEAIITLLRNNNLRKEMGLNGRRVVGSYFTWDIVVEQMLSVYEKYRI